jgi:RNA recognition motif-containing protein
MIFVREDRETSSQAGGGGQTVHNTSVYVRNLAPETSWQDLKDHMRQAGNVDSATILSNATGESIGCGMAVYQRPQDAARAICELQNTELHGSPNFVRKDRAHAGRGGGVRGGGAVLDAAAQVGVEVDHNMKEVVEVEYNRKALNYLLVTLRFEVPGKN